MATPEAGPRSAAPRRLRRLEVPAPARPAAQGEKPRYHAFDALRATAMFLVIGLHAALAYITRDIPSVLWCVRDAPTLPLFDWFCWCAMSVSNPLYFTIAGFFAVGLYDARGLRAFLVNRAQRVLVPFLVGVVTVLPATLCAWIYGWLASGRCTWREAVRLRFRDPVLHAERLGAGHLWFLEYLIVMLLAYGVYRWWADRRGGKKRAIATLAERALRSPWLPVLLTLPSAVLLWASRRRLGIDAVLDRHNAFLIAPEKLLHYATFFVVGLGLYRLRDDLDRLTRTGPLYLLLAVPVFAARGWLLDEDWTTPLTGTAALALAVLGGLFSWLAVLGLIGTALRVCQRSSPTVRYLADNSYWIYLIHMPILGLIQVNLYRVPGDAWWKFPIVLLGTLAIGGASYQAFVRYTAIGAVLHGRREREATRAIDGAA